MRGGVGAEQHGRRPRAPTFKSGRDGVTGRAASHVTPHAPSRALARSRVGSAGAGKSGFPLGVVSWAGDPPASGRSRSSGPLNLVPLAAVSQPERVKWVEGVWRKPAGGLGDGAEEALRPGPALVSALILARPALRAPHRSPPPRKAPLGPAHSHLRKNPAPASDSEKSCLCPAGFGDLSAP